MSIENEWLKPEQAAAHVHKSVHTLKKWRMDGKGPRYYKMNKATVLYHIDDLNSYIREGVCNDD